MESLIGKQVLLKFYYGNKESVNPIISKTLGRISIINFSYTGSQPQPGTFWLCTIDQERKDAFNPEHGCYIVTPQKEVQVSEIVKLVPNAYDIETEGHTVILKPKIKGYYWICPFSIKKYYIKKDETSSTKCYQSVIVPLDIEVNQRG